MLVVGQWVVAAVLFIAALIIRLYRLDVQPLWLDEGETWRTVTRNHLGTLLFDLFRPSQAYPLFHLVLKVTTRILGDSEWALRLPSAIAGALAVPALFALGRSLRGWALGLSAALLLLVSPFALWQSQDAKVYSLVLLVAILLALTLVRALETNSRTRWLLFALVALVAPFTHRLLVFTLISCVVVWALTTAHSLRRWVLAGSVLMAIALVGVIAFGLRYQNAGGQFVSVNPVTAAWLTWHQFAIGHGPGAVRRLWLLPFISLTILGGVRLLLDAFRHRHRGALVVLALGGLPALLFASLLLLQDLYEARYLTIVFPFWLLTLAWALPEVANSEFQVPSSTFLTPGSSFTRPVAWLLVVSSCFLLLASLLAGYRSLYLPDKGLFSGETVKEDYRGAVQELARRVHPDDLVILHPDTIRPLYDYYAPRVSSQPLPEPKVYDKLGRTTYGLRELDVEIRADLTQYKRAWLLVAPAHAAVVDPPNKEFNDKLGLVGLAFQYGDRNGRLQCGEGNSERAAAGFVGVLLYCNNMPSVNGTVPQPEVERSVVFGDALRLRGYSITPFQTGIRPGGTLPLTLFWEPLRSLDGTNYLVFVHLTRLDDPVPLVQIDGPPLEGGLPTSLWTDPGAQLHDERTMTLPETLSPGTYALRLGVYRAEDGQRLPVSGTSQPVSGDAVVIGEVEVGIGAVSK
jgi:hypothetical protein